MSHTVRAQGLLHARARGPCMAWGSLGLGALAEVACSGVPPSPWTLGLGALVLVLAVALALSCCCLALLVGIGLGYSAGTRGDTRPLARGAALAGSVAGTAASAAAESARRRLALYRDHQ